MKQDKLTELIKQVGQIHGSTAPAKVNTQQIRTHALHKIRIQRISSICALILTCVILSRVIHTQPNNSPKPIAPAHVSDQMQHLMRQCDALLACVNIISKTQKQINTRSQNYKRLNQLRKKLANIPDPLQNLHKQDTRTARSLVYAADNLLQKPGQRHQAKETYKMIIRLFPDNNWARIASKRLLTMKNRSINLNLKGELL